jgi:carbon starvation protein
MTAGVQKVFSPDPQLGFLAHARSLQGSLDPSAARLMFNDRLDAYVALFMTVVWLVILASAREWFLVVSGKKRAEVKEAPFVLSASAARVTLSRARDRRRPFSGSARSLSPTSRSRADEASVD